MIVLLLKVSLVLAVALCALPLLRRASAAMRHQVCLAALIAAALMPLTLLFRAPVQSLRIPIAFTAAAVNTVATARWTRWQDAVIGLWTLGAVILMARLLVGFRRVSVVRRDAIPTRETLPTPVLLADVAVPVAVGLWSPAILLPRELAEWPESHRLAALRHEAAHIERKDLWTNLLAHLICAVYWFHPLAWAVARRLRDEQESACDDAALTAGISPVSYAEALLAAAKHVRSTSMIGCHMITRTTLRNRIARLVDAGLPRTTSTSAMRRAAIASAVAIVCVGLVSAGPQAPSPDPLGKVYQMSDGISPPKLLAKINPNYTEDAKAAKVAGTVLLSVVIGSDGIAHDINVVKGLEEGLSEQAVIAVQQWRFQPGSLNGQPVAVKATIEVNFRLN